MNKIIANNKKILYYLCNHCQRMCVSDKDVSSKNNWVHIKGKAPSFLIKELESIKAKSSCPWCIGNTALIRYFDLKLDRAVNSGDSVEMRHWGEALGHDDEYIEFLIRNHGE